MEAEVEMKRFPTIWVEEFNGINLQNVFTYMNEEYVVGNLG